MAEFVYRDEHSLRIFGGGQVLARLPTSGHAGRGSVVIADADGDGKPEIVVADNGVVHRVAGRPCGLRVFGDAADTWVLSRPIWNQFEYHVSNVNDDGSIPAIETRSLASSRQNMFARVGGGTVTPGCAYAKPDLTASYLRIARDADGAHLTVRIGNGGAAVAGSGVPVSFYDGDPAAGSPLLGTGHTSAVLAPGAYEDVVLTLARRRHHEPFDLDRRRRQRQLSRHDHGVGRGQQRLRLGAGAARRLRPVPISSSPRWTPRGSCTNPDTLVVSGTARATIRNQGDAPVTAAFAVAFFEDADGDGAYDPGLDVLLGQATHGTGLAAREDAVATASVSGVVRFAGNVVHAMVDSAAAIAETNEGNNVGRSATACRVVPPVGLFTPGLERRWTTSPTQRDVHQRRRDAARRRPRRRRRGRCRFRDVHRHRGRERRAPARAVRPRRPRDVHRHQPRATSCRAGETLPSATSTATRRPEIVAVHEQGRLIAFEHDGAFKWLSEPLHGIDWGGPAIADLDGDGLPEIVIGRQASAPTGRCGGRRPAAIAAETRRAVRDVVGPRPRRHAGGDPRRRRLFERRRPPLWRTERTPCRTATPRSRTSIPIRSRRSCSAMDRSTVLPETVEYAAAVLGSFPGHVLVAPGPTDWIGDGGPL